MAPGRSIPQLFRCCWPGNECSRCRRGPDGRRAWWTLRFGLGRTCFAGAIDRNLADAATRHSVAPGPRYCASAIPANDIMAASDGARSRQGVWSHRAAGRRDRRTIRLVRALHRAGARRWVPCNTTINRRSPSRIPALLMRPADPALLRQGLEHIVGKRARLSPLPDHHVTLKPAGRARGDLRHRAASDALSFLAPSERAFSLHGAP
jgi:hypothetical protein